MKKLTTFLLITSSILILMGCSTFEGKSGSDDGADNLSITKDYEIKHNMRSDFSENYYDINELKEAASVIADDYNSKSESSSVIIEDALLEDNIATLKITYNNCKAFEGLNSESFFVGNVTEAISQGKSLKVILTDIKDASKTISEPEIKEMKDKSILITTYKGSIYLPTKALYVSDNCQVSENGYAVKRTEGIDKEMYVIFK